MLFHRRLTSNQFAVSHIQEKHTIVLNQEPEAVTNRSNSSNKIHRKRSVKTQILLSIKALKIIRLMCIL